MGDYKCEVPEFPAVPCDPTFKCECVIVCVDYSDFLRCTLPHNRQFFEKTVVVTSPEDKETQHLCTFYNVQCIVTNKLKKEFGFQKGAGINEGLKHLDRDNWVLHLDADMWLPPQTRLLLQQASLDKGMIYGIDRFNVRGFQAWSDFLAHPVLQHDSYAYIHFHNAGFKVGTRIMQSHLGGFLPIGFFQLWNPRVAGIHHYPEKETSAAHGDLRMALQWPRSRRGLIPEIIGYHLESEDAIFGANWEGRKTLPFEFVKGSEPS